MKGIELPINVLVLIAIAVIVLLAVIVLFFGSFGGPANVVSLQTVTSSACADWRNRGFGDAAAINITSAFDANKDGTYNPLTGGADCTKDNLETLALNYYGVTGPCSGAVNTVEQTIRTRVCGFS